MDTAVIVAVITVAPATLAAIAAVIAARKTQVGNDAIGDVRADIQRLSRRLTEHVEHRRIHRG